MSQPKLRILLRFILAISILLIPGAMFAQTTGSAGVDKNMLLHPPPDSWPTHHGDYSARRFSSLKVINDTNVQNLSLSWMSQVTAGAARPEVPRAP